MVWLAGGPGGAGWPPGQKYGPGEGQRTSNQGRMRGDPANLQPNATGGLAQLCNTERLPRTRPRLAPPGSEMCLVTSLRQGQFGDPQHIGHGNVRKALVSHRWLPLGRALKGQWAQAAFPVQTGWKSTEQLQKGTRDVKRTGGAGPVTHACQLAGDVSRQDRATDARKGQTSPRTDPQEVSVMG